MTIFYILLLLLSFAGYMLFLSRKTSAPAEFIPILTISSIICILFVAGLLNVLPHAAWVLLLAGIAALVGGLVQTGRKAALRQLVTPGTVLFFILIIVFAVLFRNGHLVHYDNFSHWAILVRQMVLDDRLPNFTNTYITFQSYPPGSGLFLYYISKFLGYHENLLIFVQAMMTASAALPIFAFLPKYDTSNKRGSLEKIICVFLSFCGTLLLIFGCNIDIYSLLVDALLPAFGAGMTAIALHYRDKPETAALLTLPVSAATLLLKNTGVYFVVIHFILLLCLFLREKKPLRQKKRAAAFVVLHGAVPAFVQFLWSRHVALVFEEASASKHAMSAEHYSEIFAEKTEADIQNIVHSFLHRIFDFSENPTLRVLLIINIALFVAFVIHVLFLKKHAGLLAGTLLTIDGVYSIYAAGLLATYLFSMPTSEALYLASFDRYMYTILLYLLVPFVLCMAYIFTESSKVLPAFLLGCLMLFSVGYTVYIQRDTIQQNLSDTYLSSYVYKIDTALEGHGNDLESAIVYSPTSANDAGFTSYCMRYKLMSSNIAYLYSVPTATDLQELLTMYKYLIVVDTDEQILSFLTELGISNPGPGVYTAEDLQI